MFSQLVKIRNRKYEKWPDVEFFAYHSRILALTEKAWKEAVQGHKDDTSQTADERSQDIVIFAILVKFLT